MFVGYITCKGHIYAKCVVGLWQYEQDLTVTCAFNMSNRGHNSIKINNNFVWNISYVPLEKLMGMISASTVMSKDW